ncbi:transcriptional regulator, TetR family [Streptomyces sp. 1222.5]|uniref:TetR/AcrR family transcriptional regulator n=1 Tax=unclassified Streptomyces TaxID=2593676 RepID=UPI0008957133|nr:MULTISPECIES: TetR/AcrR family transcriptional regulator [unclassified Streptomyces]PKW10975.1 TetR family transcriptional regulator [Streptomyces sp. 5112.2]SEB91428.1 transcriptional regulator, TetR family [Streptomyces sp. 1222.5]
MTGTARRGRPRSEDADVRILGAAQELLFARGYDRFVMDEAAVRAGVAKTTLYRRWPTKDHLLVALVAKIQDEVPVADTGEVRADLTVYLTAIATGLNRMRGVGRTGDRDDRSAGMVAELVAAAARHPDVGDAVRGLFARRNTLVLALLDHARERGDLRAGTSSTVLFDQLAGALYYRLLVTGEPIDAAYVRELVDHALTGAAATPHPERN